MSGFVQESHMDDAMFEEQYHQYLSRGYAVDPSRAIDQRQTTSTQRTIVSKTIQKKQEMIKKLAEKAEVEKKAQAGEQKSEAETKEEELEVESGHEEEEHGPSQPKRKERNPENDPANLEKFKGPWAPKGYLKIVEAPHALTEEQKQQLAQQAASKKVKKTGEEEEAVSMEETSEFHGGSEVDYQVRFHVVD